MRKRKKKSERADLKASAEIKNEEFEHRLTLPYEIGLHDAGLHENDWKTVEELFVHERI